MVTDWNEEARQIAQAVANDAGVELVSEPRERDFCCFATFEYRRARMTVIVATVACLEDSTCEKVADPAQAALSTWKQAIDIGYEAAR